MLAAVGREAYIHLTRQPTVSMFFLDICLSGSRFKQTHSTRRRAMAEYLFILHTDENEKATRCFQFAKIANDKGHTVNIFLVDDGVFWAAAGKDGSIKTITGDCPADYLPSLEENAVSTGVCTPCAKGRNMDEGTFLKNMKLDTGGNLIDMAATATVFNF